MEKSSNDALIISRSLERPETFGAIYDKYSTDIYQYLARRVHKDDLEDLLGDVFETSFTMRHRYDQSRSSARPWLYGIAAKKVLKYYRKQRRSRNAMEKLRGRRPIVTPFEETIVDSDQQSEQLCHTLRKLDKLSSTDGEILFLYAWQDLSYDCLLYTSPSPRDRQKSRMPSSA